ncbi:MAG TPA: Ig-like domain-containing protein, partial [Phenylobacterium sp.]
MAVTPPIPPTTKDVTVTGAEDIKIGVPLSGADLDGSVVDFRVVTTLPAHGTLVDGNGVPITVGQMIPASGNGATIYFIPDHDWNGTTTFLYASVDNAGLDDKTPATATIVITPVNDPPDAVNDSGTTPEDTPISFTTAQLLANDTDPENDTLTVTSVQGAQHGTVTFVGGVAKFTPDANYNGPASFTYTISDGHGGVDTATVNINVTPVNDPPDAVNDAGTTAEDTPIAFTAATLLGNDTDPDGDTLTITSVQDPVHGTVNFVGGVATFTPEANYSGPASFTYSISDGHGGVDTATVNITVTPVNDPLDAKDDAGTTPEDTPITFPVGTLL